MAVLSCQQQDEYNKCIEQQNWSDSWGAMEWLIEDGIWKGKIDGQSTRIFLSLYSQRKPRLDGQEANGKHPIKSCDLLPSF